MRRALVNLTKNDWFPLLSDVDSLFRGFDDFFHVSLPYRTVEKFTPPCDVHETSTHYHLQFDLPGVSKDEIKIDLTGGYLTVSGERKAKESHSQAGSESEKQDTQDTDVPRWVERHYGQFVRSVQIPENVDAEYVDASFQDGVLKVSLRKKDKEQPKRISIR